MKIVKESLTLLGSFLLVFVWQQTPLGNYTIQALGLLAALLLITSLLRRGKFKPHSLIGDNPYWSVFLLNTLVFLLVFATGGINSSLFLLLYFVGFGIAFVFEPAVVFVYLLGTALVLTPAIIQDDVTGNIIKCSTILVVGPLAYFFGREYRKEEKEDEALLALEEEAHKKASSIEQSVVEVLEEEKDIISDASEQKLKKALKETNELREETKET
jgi:hypothetical protein